MPTDSIVRTHCHLFVDLRHSYQRRQRCSSTKRYYQDREQAYIIPYMTWQRTRATRKRAEAALRPRTPDMERKEQDPTIPGSHVFPIFVALVCRRSQLLDHACYRMYDGRKSSVVCRKTKSC